MTALTMDQKRDEIARISNLVIDGAMKELATFLAGNSELFDLDCYVKGVIDGGANVLAAVVTNVRIDEVGRREMGERFVAAFRVALVYHLTRPQPHPLENMEPEGRA